MKAENNSQPSTKADEKNFIDELLTAEEVAARLRVRTSWIYGHIHAGTLGFAHVKVGHYVRFPASGVRKYIESQTRAGRNI